MRVSRQQLQLVQDSANPSYSARRPYSGASLVFVLDAAGKRHLAVTDRRCDSGMRAQARPREALIDLLEKRLVRGRSFVQHGRISNKGRFTHERGARTQSSESPSLSLARSFTERNGIPSIRLYRSARRNQNANPPVLR